MYPAMVQFAVRPRRTVGDGDRPGGSRLRLPAAPAHARTAYIINTASQLHVYRNFIT